MFSHIKPIATVLALSIGLFSSPVVLGEETESYKSKKITFQSGSNTLTGLVFTPTEKKEKYPAVTLIGPVGFVKEQAPLQYAKYLAENGYKAIIFDPTYHGESGGMPRRFESGVQKTKDIQASISYLETLDDVNPDKIFGVGICQGVNWMIDAANQDDRLKSISLVAGHYLVPAVAELYTGGKQKLATRLEKAALAKKKYESSGEIEYIPVVSTSDPEALLLPKPIHDWYMPWETNEDGRGGQWENRITRMSEMEIWGRDTAQHINKIKQPTLMIHSNRAASGPVVPKELFKNVPAVQKSLEWFEDQIQFNFYDDPTTINRAVKKIDKWFEQTS
ncbi:MAG: alpha/beta hydrolase [Rhodospirillales bacterium]|nr:alpha/beta hydrolase [Rhodospirillales bacterium]